jgi:hypothetical protein
MAQKSQNGIRRNTGDVTTKSSGTVQGATFGQTLATTPEKTVAANFAYNNQTYKPAITVTPAAFNAISANAAFEAKYPATNKNNFK